MTESHPPEPPAPPPPSPDRPGRHSALPWIIALAAVSLLCVALAVVIVTMAGDETAATTSTVTVTTAATTTSVPPSSTVPEARTLFGEVILFGGLNFGRESDCFLCGGDCWGVDSCRDLTAGAVVTVRDAGAGGVIGLGHLDAGRWVEVAEDTDGDVWGCIFRFMVRDLPSDRDFYELELSENRGSVRYSATELAALGWNVTLTLGP